MDKFSRLASSLTSSVSSTVFSTVSAVSNALPGNPVNREFEAGEQVASAGPGEKRWIEEGLSGRPEYEGPIFGFGSFQ